MLSRNNNRVALLFIICLCLFGCTVNNPGLSDLPMYTDYRTPMPAPTAPGEAFTPVMGGFAQDNTPQCAEWTKTAGPDESVIIAGEDFTAFKKSNEGKDSRFRIYSAGGLLKEADILRAEKNKAVVTINKDISKWSMYLIWPGNKMGFGKPIAVNKTESWWLGPQQAIRGSTVSVYGRNLSQKNDTLVSHVYIKPSSGAGIWATVTKVNPYKVDFTVPAYLANGEYEVWTHNGHGGKYGWSGPLKISITDGVKWSQTVFNVRSFGATGNGSTDDTEAISRALAAASRSAGATIYFPEGVYMISKMLNLADNTWWKGDGKDRSVIKCNADFSTKGAMVFGRVKNVQLSDLSFDTNGNYKGVGGDFTAQAVNVDGSSDLKILNVGFTCKGYGALRLDNANRVLIQNSSITGKTSFMGSCSNLIMDRCDFYLTNDTENAVHSWGGIGISITNCTCRDLDNSNINNGAGWGKGRFLHFAGNAGSTRFLYLSNNTTFDLGVRPVGVDQNSGEQLLWEGFTSVWSGKVWESSDAHTILSDLPKTFEAKKVIAVITAGKGAGQARWINAVDGSTLNLEYPWNVQPDKSSTIALGHFAEKIVLYNNHIDGKGEQVTSENVTASAGIQPYGGVLNFIADGNILTDVRTGIANWATQHKTGIDPNYFNLFTNNTILRCRQGILNALLELKRPGIGLMGTTYRRNTINDVRESGISAWLSPAKAAVMDNFLYEHNSFVEVPKGFLLRTSQVSNISDQTFYKNKFRSNAQLGAIDLSPRIKLRDNTYSGFLSAYSGITSKNTIEAPVHVIEINGSSRGGISIAPFTVWNTGTAKLDLKFKTSASWLNISDVTRSIANERTSTTVTLQANPAKLTPRTHVADLSVVSGRQVKKYTVLFKVIEPMDKKLNRQAVE